VKSPAFQFYPTDYLASQRVQMMTLEEEGAYIRLLCYCWQHGDIPADPSQAARLIGKGASTTLSTTVLAMFNPITGTDRMNHDRLEAERAKQAAWREKSAAGGRKSAQSRKNASTTLEPPLEGCLENGYNQNATFHLQSPSPSPPSDFESQELPNNVRNEPKGNRTTSDLSPLVSAVWSAYPKVGRERSNKADTEEAFRKIPAKDRPTPDDITSALAKWKLSLSWTDNGGAFVPGVHRWVKARQWENIPDPASTTKPSRHAGLNTMEITGNEF
jgi:uncharacterized protein YdaU (DUF1376 family)